jgi:hypothetical protein
MKDPLRALQRHFEEQYGSLDIPKIKSKKRKRGHVEPEPEKEQVSESEEEWHGIQDTSVSVGPTVESRVESRVEPVVVEFRETGEGLEEPEVVSKKKDFMVIPLFILCLLLVVSFTESSIRNQQSSIWIPRNGVPE